jgi:nitroreductase
MKLDHEAIEVIRSRRVVRSYNNKAVAKTVLWKIVEMARWAPAARNRRYNHYICLDDRDTIRQIQMVSPGMGAGLPTALIIVCIDWDLAGYEVMDRTYQSVYIDVGTAVENMLLTAHALGLGAWPMTSFSPDAVRVILNIPDHLEAVMFVGLGHPDRKSVSSQDKPKNRIRLQDLVQWGAYPDGPDPE